MATRNAFLRLFLPKGVTILAGKGIFFRIFNISVISSVYLQFIFQRWIKTLEIKCGKGFFEIPEYLIGCSYPSLSYYEHHCLPNSILTFGGIGCFVWMTYSVAATNTPDEMLSDMKPRINIENGSVSTPLLSMVEDQWCLGLFCFQYLWWPGIIKTNDFLGPASKVKMGLCVKENELTHLGKSTQNWFCKT